MWLYNIYLDVQCLLDMWQDSPLDGLGADLRSWKMPRKLSPQGSQGASNGFRYLAEQVMTKWWPQISIMIIYIIILYNIDISTNNSIYINLAGVAASLCFLAGCLDESWVQKWCRKREIPKSCACVCENFVSSGGLINQELLWCLLAQCSHLSRSNKINKWQGSRAWLLWKPTSSSDVIGETRVSHQRPAATIGMAAHLSSHVHVHGNVWKSILEMMLSKWW